MKRSIFLLFCIYHGKAISCEPDFLYPYESYSKIACSNESELFDKNSRIEKLETQAEIYRECSKSPCLQIRHVSKLAEQTSYRAGFLKTGEPIFLDLAIEEQDIEQVHWLLQNGADPNNLRSQSLKHAIDRKNITLIKLLLHYKASSTIYQCIEIDKFCTVTTKDEISARQYAEQRYKRQPFLDDLSKKIIIVLHLAEGLDVSFFPQTNVFAMSQPPDPEAFNIAESTDDFLLQHQGKVIDAIKLKQIPLQKFAQSMKHDEPTTALETSIDQFHQAQNDYWQHQVQLACYDYLKFGSKVKMQKLIFKKVYEDNPGLIDQIASYFKSDKFEQVITDIVDQNFQCTEYATQIQNHLNTRFIEEDLMYKVKEVYQRYLNGDDYTLKRLLFHEPMIINRPKSMRSYLLKSIKNHLKQLPTYQEKNIPFLELVKSLATTEEEKRIYKTDIKPIIKDASSSCCTIS